MCGSHNFGNNGCCPSGQVFQEKLCGNVTSNLVNQNAWAARPGVNDYFQGTFQVFNAGDTGISFDVLSSTPGSSATDIPVPPGSTVSISVANPIQFLIDTTGSVVTGSTWCAVLYKRVY